MNNTDIILPLLNFSDPDKFYFVQIFKRRKDNPGMDKDVRVLENLTISSSEDFAKKMDRIIEICDRENARAYIRLNRRSKKKIALQTLSRIATMIAADQYDVKNTYWSVVGEYASEEDKSWVFDIDWKDFEGRKAILGEIHSRIEELQIETGRQPRMDYIPTKNGRHLITRPFNIQKFTLFLAAHKVRMDHHKDNPTILYIP
jgi:hypothetical protein